MPTKPTTIRPAPQPPGPETPTPTPHDWEVSPVVRPQRAWEILHIHPSTGWKWVRAGRIRVTRMGRVTWIPVSELEDLVAGRKEEQTDAAD